MPVDFGALRDDPADSASDADATDRSVGHSDGLGSRERYRRLRASIVSTGVSRILGMILSAVSVPVVARSLHPDDYAVYVLATSVSSVLPFVELGVGLSMVTTIAQALGRRDGEAVRHSVASATVMTVTLALLVAAAWSLAFGHVDWSHALGLSTAPESEVRLSLHLVVLSLCLGLPASLGFRVLFSQQRTGLVAWLQFAGTVFSTAAAVVTAAAGGGPAAFVAAMLFPPIAVSVVTTAVILKRNPLFRPALGYARRHEAIDLLRLGSVFSVQQFAITMGSQIDTVVIARAEGAPQVATYGVAARLATVAGQLANAAFVSLWPAFGEAYGRGDHVWIRRTLQRALVAAAALAAIFIVGFTVLGAPVQRAWAGDQYAPSRLLMFVFGLYGAILFLQTPAQMLLNALGVGRMQLVAIVAMLALNVPLTLWLVGPLDSPGPVVATVFSTFVCVTLPSIARALRLSRASA